MVILCWKNGKARGSYSCPILPKICTAAAGYKNPPSLVGDFPDPTTVGKFLKLDITAEGEVELRSGKKLQENGVMHVMLESPQKIRKIYGTD